MKILLLRANETRHKKLSKILAERLMLAAEIVEQKNPLNLYESSKLKIEHFAARDASEKIFFSFGTFNSSKELPVLEIEKGSINSEKVLTFINNVRFDIAITFGVSILKRLTIDTLKNRVLGIHLGLSPYYRGSGTNFFPFVNKEVEAVGFTLMHLDEGVDTGLILHQGRAPIFPEDDIHSVGNRNISLMFDHIVKLIDCELDFSISFPRQLNLNTKYYKKSDFTDQSLKTALDNIKGGLIPKYISNAEVKNSRFPIFKNPILLKNS